MFTKIWNWLFRQTKIGQLVDGNKRLIGFVLAMLGWLIDGLAIGAQYFPGVPWIAAASVALVELQQNVGTWLKDLGYGLMVVGVVDGGVKDHEERKAAVDAEDEAAPQPKLP